MRTERAIGLRRDLIDALAEGDEQRRLVIYDVLDFLDDLINESTFRLGDGAMVHGEIGGILRMKDMTGKHFLTIMSPE